jgi:large repetitive protein
VKKNGYYANWDGTHNGNDLPVATYYYIYTPNMDGYSPTAGSISILR